MSDSTGRTTTYSHDAAGQLVGLTSVQNGRTSFSYDLAGREAVKSLANGVRVTEVYDAAGRVLGVNTGGSAGLVRRLTYTLDSLGRRGVIAANDGARTSYVYDAAGQLSNEQRAASGINVTHIYDPVGNRLTQIDSGLRTSYVYDAANQLNQEQTNTARTTYLHDAAGNRTQKDDPAATTYYTWDARSRLSVAEPVAGPVTFAYDGTGRCATKESGGDTTRYVWDFKKLLQEADGGTGATETQYLSTENEYGDLVSGYGSGASNYYGFDALGSTEVLLDDSGSVTAKFEYRAFGITNETSGAGGESPGLALPAPLPSELGGGTSATTGEPFAYVGRQSYYRDNELSLYILGMGGGTEDGVGGNFYGPGEARFLKPDPIKERSGQTNFYMYCGNDPVNRTDPSGNRLLVDPYLFSALLRFLADSATFRSWTDARVPCHRSVLIASTSSSALPNSSHNSPNGTGPSNNRPGGSKTSPRSSKNPNASPRDRPHPSVRVNPSPSPNDLAANPTTAALTPIAAPPPPIRSTRLWKPTSPTPVRTATATSSKANTTSRNSSRPRFPASPSSASLMFTSAGAPAAVDGFRDAIPCKPPTPSVPPPAKLVRMPRPRPSS